MKTLDIPKILFYASCAAVIFVYGMVVEAYKVFPYQAINFLYDSAHQVYAEWDTLSRSRPVELLRKARHEGNGVTKFDARAAAPGLTFLTGFFERDNEMRLIRLDGTLIHRWTVRFTEIWPDPSHIRPAETIPAGDWNTDIHGTMVLPDGSVVFNFEYMGLAKVDRCGDVIWTLPKMTHHSVERAKDGGFWVGGRNYEETRSTFPSLGTPYWEDTLLKVSDDGEVLAEISVPGLFYKNGLQAVLLANGVRLTSVPEVELVHLNDIEELSSAMADKFPQFAAGDLLLSLRTQNLLMVVDPATEVVKWHQTGPWMRQHDADFQPDGTITVFNNNSDDTKTGRIAGGSSIMSVDPKTKKTTVRYPATDSQSFYTQFKGKHQVLDNGNVLITEAEAGRVFEVTRNGDVVWEFIDRYDEHDVSVMNTGQRLPEDYFTVEDWSCE